MLPHSPLTDAQVFALSLAPLDGEWRYGRRVYRSPGGAFITASVNSLIRRGYLELVETRDSQFMACRTPRGTWALTDADFTKPPNDTLAPH